MTGASRMDMSLRSGGSGTSSKGGDSLKHSTNSKGQISSSDGRLSRRRRSGSPASVDKAGVDAGSEDPVSTTGNQTLTDSWVGPRRSPPPSSEG